MNKDLAAKLSENEMINVLLYIWMPNSLRRLKLPKIAATFLALDRESRLVAHRQVINMARNPFWLTLLDTIARWSQSNNKYRVELVWMMSLYTFQLSEILWNNVHHKYLDLDSKIYVYIWDKSHTSVALVPPIMLTNHRCCDYHRRQSKRNF